MSVWAIVWSLLEKSCFRIGTRIAPGTPANAFRSSSLSSPASKFDSPSRNRSLVLTFRDPNDG